MRPALEERGADPLTAALLAELTVSVLHVAIDAWLDADDGRTFGEVVGSCFERLRTVLPAAPPST
jgi:hypothetical protein